MCPQVPAQVLCPFERAAMRYINKNARVDDPVEALAEEKRQRPWTPEEKRVFNEKFLQHPKVGPDFNYISSGKNIQNRTVRFRQGCDRMRMLLAYAGRIPRLPGRRVAREAGASLRHL
jgi:hypothetical protein